MLPRVTARDSVEDLRRLRSKRPAHAGFQWARMPFPELLDAVRNRVRALAWRPGAWRMHIFRDGMDVAASLEIPGYPLETTGAVSSLGVIASNACRRTTTMYVGVTLPRIGSSVVMGAVRAPHKHTTRMNVDKVVDKMLDESSEVLAMVDENVERLKKKKLGHDSANRLMHAAGRANMMPWSRIGRVDTLWNQNSDRSAWAMLVAFGHVSDANTPQKHMDRLHAFYRLVNGQDPGQIH